MKQRPLSEVQPKKPKHIPFRKLFGYRRLWPLHEFLAKRANWYYPLFTLMGRNRATPINADTAFVVAAAGGCSNTFVRNSVRYYMPERHFGSHKHMPLEVIQAAKYNIPCLVIIRNPMDSLSSVVSRGGYAYNPGSLEWALKDYTLFYRSIGHLTDHYVATTFQDVIADLPAVMDRVNAKFGVEYKVPAKGSDDARAVREMAKWREENRFRSKEDVKVALYNEYFDEAREAALDTYRWFSELHGLPVTEDTFDPVEYRNAQAANASG